MSEQDEQHNDSFRKTGEPEETRVECEGAEHNANVPADPTDAPQLVLTKAADLGSSEVDPGMRIPTPLFASHGVGMRSMLFGTATYVPVHKTGKRVLLNCVEGSVVVTANDEEWTLEPGGLAYLPKGTDHSFRTPNGPARLIVTMFD